MAKWPACHHSANHEGAWAVHQLETSDRYDHARSVDRKKFLTSERVGRERNYTPIVTEQEYMRADAKDFMTRYRGNSVESLVKTMYEGEKLSSEDIMGIKQWLKRDSEN